MAKTSVKQQAANNFDTLFGTRKGERIVSGSFKMLAHDRITVRPQVRRTFPKSEMEELRASIREIREQKGGIEGSGVLQALLVCPDGEGYRLIAGEKRFRATRDEAIPEVPCVVIAEASEPVIRLMQLTENSQRTPPPILDEALAIRDTMQDMNLSLRDMARMLGKSKGYVESRVNLPEMDKDIQEMVSARADTLRHARLIHPVKDTSLRRKLISTVLDEEASEREIRRRIEEASQPHDTKEVSARADTQDSQHRISADMSKGSADTTPTDPLTSTLRPAVAFAAEFGRQIQKLKMTRQYRQEVKKELNLLEQEITRIKKSLQ